MTFVVNTGSQQRDHEELARYQQHYRAQGLEMYAQPLPTGGYQVTIAPPPAPAPAPPHYGGSAGPQQYGAPAAPQQYGAPAAPQQYGAPAAPQQYGAPAAPQQYGAPAAPQQYGAPAAPQQYGAQNPPAQGYGAQNPPAQGYGAPAAQQYGGGGGAYAMAGGGMMAASTTLGEGVQPLSNQRVAYLRKVYGLLGAAAFIAVFAGWASISLGPTATMTSPEGLTVEVPLLVSLMLGSRVMMWAAFGVC